MTEIVLGSRNAHKRTEIERMLEGQAVSVLALPDYVPEVVEDRDSFRGNAEKKALSYARATGHLCLADDSGLMVDALGGAPGVYSARFGGEPGNHARNNALLLERLADFPEAGQRHAVFVCVMALADPEGLRLLVEGRLEGQIIDELRGAHGFGYDPLFHVAAAGKTLAEMSPEEKDEISHRGRALRKLQQALPAVL